MNIQSASLDVPGGCPNKCKFCITDTWKQGDLEMLHNVFRFDNDHNLIFNDFYERLLFLRQQNVDTLVFTGSSSEAIYNKPYLDMFAEANKKLGNNRFINIEIQTSGVKLQENFDYLKNIGIKTISLSLASFNTEKNFEIMQTPNGLKTWTISDLCMDIKKADFNLRLSLNINTDGYSKYLGISDYVLNKNNAFENLFKVCILLKADQITFRKLYSSKEYGIVSNWIKENSAHPDWWDILTSYIMKNGRALNKLPFGAIKYSINGMSTIIDDDCMAKEGVRNNFKYLILRRNCRLYSEWDDPASLIF